MNYFEVFDLPRTLNLDLAALEKSFYERSRRFHPDRHTRSAPEERRQALQMTALLNDAYRTLKHPVRRAEYLVALEGFKPDGSKVPRAFLMEVFEINERLDEVKAAIRVGNVETSEVEALRREIQEKSRSFDARIENTSREWDRLVLSNASDEDKTRCLESLTELLSESSYIRNLERELEDRV
ncbi:MAG TPA: Fe-S protein assembly co-chaperone HscB [Terriglobia bacterium]|nr:Fe-S protein assembly co-chaperone HscB [Terriglobia bacterium]